MTSRYKRNDGKTQLAWLDDIENSVVDMLHPDI